VSADLGFLSPWGLSRVEGGIRVNGMTETGLPGVFAAGDIAVQEGAPRLKLITSGWGQVTLAVNRAKKYIDPAASVFPGHSSEKRF